MRLQVLSDLHLDSETFDPVPAPGAELLVLAGDIDPSWQALQRFSPWPVPVLFVAGNHEFDGRELREAWPALRERCRELGFVMLEGEQVVLSGADGRRVRFVGTVRWSDFDLFGDGGRKKAMRAGAYFQRVMQATCDGQPFGAEAVRGEALACRQRLHELLNAATPSTRPGDTGWEATVAITHFAPTLRSADPRYGAQSGTASFCNADDDLLPAADLWLHGHVHCRHDYIVDHGDGRSTRVVCQARGLEKKGETEGFDGLKLIDV